MRSFTRLLTDYFGIFPHRRGCGAAARSGCKRDPYYPKAHQRHHLAGTQRERCAPAQTGDEDQDEDQQGRRGETYPAQTGECLLHRTNLEQHLKVVSDYKVHIGFVMVFLYSTKI